MSNGRIIVGDCRHVLSGMEPESVDCCVTSPPYWGLRDYGIKEQIGLEPCVDAWVAEIVAVMEGVRRGVGIELNPAYARLAEERIHDQCGLLASTP